MFMDIFANAFKAKSHYIKKYTFTSTPIKAYLAKVKQPLK